MHGDVDSRLVGLLRAALGLSDALRDMGVAGEISVSLPRQGGLALLETIAGTSIPEAEAISQRGRPARAGLNSLAAGGLTFLWPKGPEVTAAANDNAGSLARRFGFEEETPALR